MVQIRRANNSDKKFMLTLRNEPYIIRTCAVQDIVKERVHERWCKMVFSRPDKHVVFIVWEKKQRIGYVRFYREDSKSCWVSIALREEFQGQGNGSEALAAATADLPWPEVTMVLADVRKDNVASQNFFSKQGYEPIGENKNGLLTYRKIL